MKKSYTRTPGLACLYLIITKPSEEFYQFFPGKIRWQREKTLKQFVTSDHNISTD